MSGVEAIAHALAGSTGGIVAMTLLYPLENIRTRLQVQVKRKGGSGPARSAEAAAPAAAATLQHTHATHVKPTPEPEECISPETPYQRQQQQTSARLTAPLSPQPVPLNTPRRTLPTPEDAPELCLACVANQRDPAAGHEQAEGTYVLPSGEVVYQFNGALDCVRQVCAREGPLKLYSGLYSALVGVGASSAVYFFLYYFLKAAVLRHSGARSMGPLHNLGVASVAGVLNVFATLPIWLINTRMTLNTGVPYKGLWDAVTRIHAEEGLSGFYRGLIPSLILVSNPAIQFVVYEQCIRIWTKHVARAAVAAGSAAAAGAAPVRLTSLHYFVLGAFAKAVATVATYPYQVVKSRLQASRAHSDSPASAAASSGSTSELIGRMWREEGVASFFNGMGAKMSQTVLNSAFMFAVYERLLRVFLRFLKWIKSEYRHLPAPAP